MGMHVRAAEGSGGGRRRRRGRSGGRPIADINMTPFIDVMLVLLIIFMVAAPLMTVGVPIDLPESRAKAMEGLTKPITVSIDGKGRVFLQENEIRIEEVAERVQALARQGGDERIYLRGDKTADYGLIMRVMGRLNGAGFKKIGLVTTEEIAAR